MNENKVQNIVWIFLVIALMTGITITLSLILAPSADAFNATGTNYKATRTSQGLSGNTGTSTSWVSRFTGTANQAGNLNALNTLFRLIVGWFGRMNINIAPDQQTPTLGAHHPYRGPTKDANLISYWQFEHGSNKTGIAIDSAGQNNGTINGATFTDEGAIGSAYEFDGSNDYIDTNQAANGFNVSGTNPITVSAWVYPNTVTPEQKIVSKMWSIIAGYELMIASGQANFRASNGTSGSTQTAQVAISPNVWSHLVGEYDGTTLRIWKNGVAGSTAAINRIGENTFSLKIGVRETAASLWFNGTIDQVMIYNKSLTASEIYEMYLDGRINSSSTVSTDQDLGASAVNQTDYDNDALKNIFNWYRNETSLTVLNMPFEGGSNATWTRDYSPYGSNGTIINAIYNTTGGVDGRGAYQFDGDTDYITHGDLEFNYTDFSVSIWAKSPTNNASSSAFPIHVTNLIGKGNWNDATTWFLGYASSGSSPASTIGFAYGIIWSSAAFYSVNNYNLSQWNHFVGVANSTHQLLYLNGLLVVNQTINHGPVLNAYNLEIARSSYVARYFNGSIDEVHIFNRSLTAEQIYSLYMLEHNRIVSNETKLNETWKCCITPNDGTTDGPTYCSNNATITNSKPTTPVLLVPYNSTTIINRTPEFIWTNSVDADGETLTYEFMISDESAFAAPILNITGIAQGSGSNTSYINATEFALDDQYYWRARAWDGTQYSDWSTVFNFTLESFLAVSLVVNSTNFGTMSPWDTNDTSDNNPNPLLMENIGNIRANVTVTGTRLFDLGGFPSEYYQFKIALNETSSFDQTQSTMSYTNMTNVSSRIDTALLDWHNANDTAEMDINVTVPSSEPKGAKSSLITITVS